MKILAIEFSSPQRSVAVVHRADACNEWVEHEAIETGSNNNKPFELIETVLRQAKLEREQIESLVVGLGPGSYTGIRAAIALAQGWQLGRSVNLIGVSSAHCLAAQACASGLTGPIELVIDAQRGEFYLAQYQLDASGWHEIRPLRLVSRAELDLCISRGDKLVGPEIDKFLPQSQPLFPRASTLAKLGLSHGKTIAGEDLEPIYLRQPAFVKAPPPRVLPE